MLLLTQSPDDTSTPVEESDEPRPVFSGDQKGTPSRKGGGTGEFVGRDYMKSLQRAKAAEEAPEREAYKADVRRALETGAERMGQRKARQAAGQASAFGNTGPMSAKKSPSFGGANDAQQERVAKEAREETERDARAARDANDKFDKAERELKNGIKETKRKIVQLESSADKLERELDDSQRAIDEIKVEESEGDREIKKLERELDEILKKRNELKRTSNKSFEQRSELDHLGRDEYKVRGEIIKLEREAKSGGRESSREALAVRAAKAKLQAVQKSIANLEEVVGDYEDLLRSRLSHRRKPDRAAAWHEFEQELIAKGIRIY
jgi:chromosome segregation ATPase